MSGARSTAYSVDLMTPDPLVTFVHEFDLDGEPPPGWVERWAHDGEDPLAMAWHHSDSPSAMHRLLVLIHSAHAATALTAWERARSNHAHPDAPRRSVRGCPLCAAAIREAVPPPPPLAATLTTRCDDHTRSLWATEAEAGKLLYMAGRAGVERRLVVRAACDCVRLVAPLFPSDDPRPAAALDAAERWARGEAGEEALRRALDDTEEALRPFEATGAALQHALPSHGGPGLTRAECLQWATGAAVGAVRHAVWAAYFVAPLGRAPSLQAKDAAEGAVTALAYASRREGEVIHWQPPCSPSVREAEDACVRAVRARIPALPTPRSHE